MAPSASGPDAGSRDLGEHTNLPLQLTGFVGRGTEIDEVKRLVSESRLVTLTGAGGIGKTRLALEVAGQMLAEFAQGVWLVELAGLTDPGLVPEAVVTALGFMIQPGLAPTESLIGMLRPRSLLCLLDNCEHLIEAAAQLTDALLKHCPELRIMATSRDVLGVAGEVTWRVPSMATPDMQRLQTLDELHRCETVQLFIQRARAALPGFELKDDNAESVVRICQRVDGIPLAIELIAARTRSISVGAIDERIADWFNLATGGGRVSLPRQRTLLATFDWSYELLSEEEKRVFRRLAVFAGGFTLDAAEAVCMSDNGEDATQPLLQSLIRIVDKSLIITQEVAGAGERYRLLEPLRQYADDRLSEAHEADTAHRRHAAFYLALGDAMYAELRGPNQVRFMALAREDVDNFRECFGWALQHDVHAALQLGVALERYWIKASPAEGRVWLQRALEVYGPRDELRATALYDATVWAWYRGDNDDARKRGQECLALARTLESDLHIGLALSALATVAARDSEGSLAQSLSLFQQAEHHIRAADDPEALGRLLNNFGSVLLEGGDFAGARAKIDEALALARSRNDVWQIGGILESLADVEYASGEVTSAERDWRQVLEMSGQIGGRIEAAFALAGLARIAVADERPERYLRLLGAASNLLTLSGRIDPVTEDAIADARAQSRTALGESVSEAIWRDGTRLSLMDAVRFGLGAEHSSERSNSEITHPVGSEVVERTFMFSDIVRSTELVALIGDDAWHELVEWHHRTLREAFVTHRGEEVDSAGDGFFVAFPTARSAADCAIALQRALAEHRHSHGFAPFVRLGLHTTAARHSHGGYRGKGVHVAARIAAQAGADEILVSSTTAAVLTGHYVLSPPRPATLKGIAEEVLVASLGWR